MLARDTLSRRKRESDDLEAPNVVDDRVTDDHAMRAPRASVEGCPRSAQIGALADTGYAIKRCQVGRL